MASEGASHSHTLYAQLVSKAPGHEHESELYELAQLAGVTMDPEVFKIVLDLLEMKCSPKTIADILHSMLKHSTFNSTRDPHLDLSQSDPSKNLSTNVGQRSGSLPTPFSHNNSSSSGRSTSGNQSRYSTSNITVRSTSGNRTSGSQASLPSSTGTSKRTTRPDSSSSYLSKDDSKTRKHR